MSRSVLDSGGCGDGNEGGHGGYKDIYELLAELCKTLAGPSENHSKAAFQNLII